MMRWLMNWLQRALVVLAVAFVATYSGDWVIYKLRGSPQSKVTVYRYITIPLKGNKQEYDYQGSIDVPCSISIFSQAGQAPCWRLRRNTNQGMTI